MGVKVSVKFSSTLTSFFSTVSVFCDNADIEIPKPEIDGFFTEGLARPSCPAEVDADAEGAEDRTLDGVFCVADTD